MTGFLSNAINDRLKEKDDMSTGFPTQLDEPIEQEILRFVRHMLKSMETAPARADDYIDAYRTVEKHIQREIELRAAITPKGGDKK